MEKDMLDLIIKRISDLEKKLELYYEMLKVENELSFIIKGSYTLQDKVDRVLSGNY